MNIFGPPNVEKLKARGDVRKLLRALSYKKDASVQVDAAGALGEIKDARAVEPLIAALNLKHSEDVRKAAAGALCEIGTPAVEPLIAALKDNNKGVRMAAAGALGGIKDARAVEPLIAALKNSNKGVRMAAAEALGGIKDARAVGPLIAALKDSDEYVRMAAAGALGEIGGPDAARARAAFQQQLEQERRKRTTGTLREHETDLEKGLAYLQSAEWAAEVRRAMNARDQAARDEWIRQGRPGAGRSHRCKMCDKAIYGEETVIEMQKQAVCGNAGGILAAQRWEQDSGYRCKSCSSEYCKDCLEKKAPGNIYGGKSCPICDGLFEIIHG